MGAWGDSFVAYGNLRAAREKAKVESVGIVHYGFDSAIADFLRLQAGVGAVEHVRPVDMAAYRFWLHKMSEPGVPLSEYAGELLRGTGVRPEQVCRTHVYNLTVKQPVHRWHDPVLPVGATAWAKAFTERMCEGRPFLMLHPISTQSSPIDGHWPWWKQAIEWLTEEVAPKFGIKLLWTGQEAPFEVRSPQIVNALGLTRSMMDVFALQRLARLTIATSNGVAHWAVMDKTPAVICCNNHMLPEERHIFKEWISTEPVVQVEYREKLDVFQRKVCTALSEVGL